MERDLDGMLCLFIETLLERGHPGVQIPLVLHAGGLVVSGNAIPASAYFEQIGATMRGADHDLSALFQELADMDRAREAEKERLERELDEATRGGRELSEEQREEFANAFYETEPDYVHLKDVLIYGAGADPIRLPFWRARLNDISGWTFRGERPELA